MGTGRVLKEGNVMLWAKRRPVRLIVANDTSKIYYALMFCSNRNFNIQLLWSEDILY